MFVVPRTVASTLALGLAAATLISGCPSGFETDSAYEQEQYLCDPALATEWADAVEDCRDEFLDDGGCVGIVSIRGTIQGVPVVFSSYLETTMLDNVTRLDASVSRRDISLQGVSPYFQFDLTAGNIGGTIPLVGAPVVYTIGPTPNQAMEFDDLFVEAAIRITAGDSRDVNFVTGSLTLTVQELGEIAGSFDAVGFGQGSALEGCFHAFDANPSQSTEGP
jgi:hypothetical protein